MFYHNFRSFFSNSASAILTFINQAIAESNTGYANSEVPIKLELKCVLDSKLQDNSSLLASLFEFKDLAGISIIFIIKQHLCICLGFFSCIIHQNIKGSNNKLNKENKQAASVAPRQPPAGFQVVPDN